MALRILQFSTLFAIGFYFSPTLCEVPDEFEILKGPDISYAQALDTPEKILSIALTDPKDVIILKGQTTTLRCDARSSIKGLEVTWLHNGSPVPPNDTRWSQLQDGSLHIPKVLSGKRANGVTGEYQCLVRNKIGALLSGVAKLRVASMDRNFTRNPNNLSVPESQPGVLQCNIHSVPPAEIQWEFNNQPLPQHTRYVPLPNGALLISKTQFSNAGSYRCKATNHILNVTKYSRTALLTVSPPLAGTIPPSFLPLDISPNITTYVGENLNLYCAVMGWPIPTVQWLNNDRVVGNSTTFQISSGKARGADNFTCMAYNSVDRITQTFRVEVHQKPQFNVTPISKSYPAAQTVRLDCQALGVPEPKIYWLKDGQPLTHDTRIKKQPTGLVFSHTFNSDSGIYQCIAVNSAGKIWTAAQIEINVSLSPRPPENVQCRPYDNTSICLSWKPPGNVSVQAYSVHSFYKAQGLEVKEVIGPEYVTNMTHFQAESLNVSTNYTFYIRTYSKAASDRSEKVVCETGVKGNRNLDITPVNADSVSLRWAEISTDVSCDGAKSFYKVQWKREGHSSINVERTSKHRHVVTGLSPGTNYEFRVTSTSYSREFDPWTPYTHSKLDNTYVASEETENTTDSTDNVPVPPAQLEGTPQSPVSIKLTWLDVSQKKFYTVCYVPVKEGRTCEDGKLLKSYSNKLVVPKLKPNTTYEFKVRTHNLEGISGSFSKSIEVQTPADVPSAVQDLKYKVTNETTVCLRWKAPAHKNGKLQKYIISYTPDRDRPLEEWTDVMVPSYQRKSTACWLGEQDMVSTFLGNLTSGHRYTVLVRATSEVGIGKPAHPIVVTTSVGSGPEEQAPDLQNEIEYHKKVGVIVGVIMALMCVACCITCILVRRRCLKRRALARVRMAASNNYYPAVAHYTSHVGAVQVRLEDPCAANVQETQHLVDEAHSTHIPPVSPSHLDTKGGEEFPNGHVNGSAKPYMNGHLSNGHVHITENPQYYAFECNGHAGPKKPKHPPKLRFEEDSNSNVKSSKFYDLYRLFENSKRSNPNYHQCNPHVEQEERGSRNSNSESLDLSANTTQLTCLDDSLGVGVVNSRQRTSPILGPNG